MLCQAQNVTILTYMSSVFDNPVLHDLAPIIAAVAITKSFLGHYMGTKEGFVGLIRRVPSIQKYSPQIISRISMGVIGLFVWIAAVFNPSALGLIENLSGPILAIILFLMPAYAVKVVPSMKKYAGPSTYFVAVIGLLALGAIVMQVL
jgi:serine transporter